MRLFTGIAIPPDVAMQLQALIERLRPLARIRWSPVENLHITTRFIGAWKVGDLEQLQSGLRGIRMAAFQIPVRSLGFYLHGRSPRIFWAGVEAVPELVWLAAETDRILAMLGFPPEDKTYAPHITLARIPNRGDVRALASEVELQREADFGEILCDRFHLYQSEPRKKENGEGPDREVSAGSVYTQIATFKLND